MFTIPLVTFPVKMGNPDWAEGMIPQSEALEQPGRPGKKREAGAVGGFRKHVWLAKREKTRENVPLLVRQIALSVSSRCYRFEEEFCDEFTRIETAYEYV